MVRSLRHVGRSSRNIQYRKPYVFNNTDHFFSQVPGEIIYFHKTKEEDIDEQVSRDNAEFRSRFSKDSKPGRFIY